MAYITGRNLLCGFRPVMSSVEETVFVRIRMYAVPLFFRCRRGECNERNRREKGDIAF